MSDLEIANHKIDVESIRDFSLLKIMNEEDIIDLLKNKMVERREKEILEAYIEEQCRKRKEWHIVTIQGFQDANHVNVLFPGSKKAISISVRSIPKDLAIGSELIVYSPKGANPKLLKPL